AGGETTRSAAPGRDGGARPKGCQGAVSPLGTLLVVRLVRARSMKYPSSATPFQEASREGRAPGSVTAAAAAISAGAASEESVPTQPTGILAKRTSGWLAWTASLSRLSPQVV